MIPLKVKNPTVILNGQSLTFQTEIETGMYLEFKSKDDCKLYDKSCNFVRDVAIKGNVPELKSGKNKVKFSCTSDGKVDVRARVTVIGQGEKL